MGLDMKYFVLKPSSRIFEDPYANASRVAMHAYANSIASVNPELAKELREWANREYELSKSK